jgi:hypothetical protein
VVDLAVRARAGYELFSGLGVLGGWSAAEVLGVVRPRGPSGGDRGALPVPPAPGPVVRNDTLLPGDATLVGGLRVTTALRTAFDLGRRPPLVEAVVAVDALSRVFGFAPREVVPVGYDHLGARGCRQLPAVVALADPRAESPMETRIRLALHADGLVPPVLQHPVRPYVLDLAYRASGSGSSTTAATTSSRSGRPTSDDRRETHTTALARALGGVSWRSSPLLGE